ncbi:MAG: type II secretion system F family protein [Sedimentisphaerales bacterium]|nr:type II secretion system F family protein [Sedimentisphaerales bacterium]
MAEFMYKGVDRGGQAISGVIEAVDRRKAVSDLAAQGHFVSELIEKAGAIRDAVAAASPSASARRFSLSSNRITSKDIVAVTAQLSTALRTGLPILNAVQIIAEQQHKPPLKKLLLDLAEAVRAGDSLSEAMADYPRVFSKLYVSMVQVGETGGILDQTMSQLSKLLLREQKTKTNMKNALVYPLLVLVAGIISVIIMLTAVFPKMIDTLGGSVALMPWPTRMLMSMSNFLIDFGWLLAIILGILGFLFVKWKRSEAGRLAWDSGLLKVPILGNVLRAIAVGRFARTLGALAKSGINILPALGVVRDTLGNELLGRKIDEVAERVKTGEPVAVPLGSSGLFPPLLVQIVNIGEQTGTVDELLLNAADTFDEEADTAITRFMAVFPALLIMLLAVVIGFIIVATLLPIMSMDLGGIGG